MDEDIRTLIKNEVRRQLASSTTNVAKETKSDIADNLKPIIADMEENLETLKVFCASLKEEEIAVAVQQKPVSQPVASAPVKETHLKGKGIIFKKTAEPEPEEEDEPDEEDLSAELDAGWVKTQDGDLEKGETQIWKYGNHELTVWNDGRKYFAQVDGEKEEELWRQKDLEKIQRRVEKLP